MLFLENRRLEISHKWQNITKNIIYIYIYMTDILIDLVIKLEDLNMAIFLTNVQCGNV